MRPSGRSDAAFAGQQKAHEDFSVVFLKADLVIVDAVVAEHRAQRILPGGDGFAVLFSDECGVHQHWGGTFEIDEADGAIKFESQLILFQQLEDNHVVFAKPQVLEAALEWFGVHQQVGDDHDEGTLRDAFGGFVQDFGQSGFTAGAHVAQFVEDETEV